MKPFGLVIVTALLAFAAPLHAQQPEISLQVVEMSPASPATLHKNDFLYLRIRYETNVPMWIRAEYRDHGARAAKARTNAAGLLDPGQGETLAWVAFNGSATVDTIHLSASASGRDGFASQDVTVGYTWDGQPSQGQSRETWVEPLLAREKARQQQAFADMEQGLKGTGSGGIGAVSVGLGLGVVAIAGAVLIASFAWPVWGLVRWSGGWRTASAVPIVAVVLWAIKDGVDLVRDPTSHNLLPFEFVIAAFFIVPYMLVVAIWRRQVKKRANG